VLSFVFYLHFRFWDDWLLDSPTSFRNWQDVRGGKKLPIHEVFRFTWVIACIGLFFFDGDIRYWIACSVSRGIGYAGVWCFLFNACAFLSIGHEQGILITWSPKGICTLRLCECSVLFCGCLIFGWSLFQSGLESSGHDRLCGPRFSFLITGVLGGLGFSRSHFGFYPKNVTTKKN